MLLRLPLVDPDHLLEGNERPTGVLKIDQSHKNVVRSEPETALLIAYCSGLHVALESQPV